MVHSSVPSNAYCMRFQKHILREICLCKSRSITHHSDMKLLLTNTRWMHGFEERVSLKGEAPRLSSSLSILEVSGTSK